MKPRGQFIIDEFALLRSVAGKSGLELPPEYVQGRQLFRKRDMLFKKLRLNPDNEHHVAFLSSIIYDHLYFSEPSAADTKYGDDKDYDLLVRFINYQKKKQSKRRSEQYRSFIENDSITKAEYADHVSVDAFRMRLNRAAKKAVDGKMKLTAKRKARLKVIVPAIKEVFEISYRA